LVFVFGKYATLLQFSRWLTYDFILQAEKKGKWELLNASINPQKLHFLKGTLKNIFENIFYFLICVFF